MTTVATMNDANEQDDKKEREMQAAQARGLGLARWVQVAFMVCFLVSLWLLDKIVTMIWLGLVLRIWPRLGELNPMAVTAIAAVLAGIITFVLYRNAKVNRVTHEVVGELAKVTWPSRKETYTSSIVVVITSVIAAAILGGFDAAWSAITDLIYKV
jgi:preprotein translocase subunit SecE